ncbi:DUF2382 domain-containing protein [Pseudokineococcus basanitobsidens]|uniref:DUF2382 domain-containing protein n=1 Tax=Pseudokineococcus basanitobsidens TaxID=1926649 RepID=A0ABU8RMZ3_9ACTN
MVTASQERAVARTERVPVERVRVSKRVVTRRRRVEVEVELRHEELVVTREPLEGGAGADRPADEARDRDREVVLVLHEEVPVVSVEARPVERVRVAVRRVEGTTPVTVDLAREVVEVEGTGAAPGGSTEAGPR